MDERRLTILLAEDNLGDARLMSILMEESSWLIKLVHVTNGEDALTYLRRKDGREIPDLILVDLKMPRLDGLGFLRERQMDSSLASIPVIVLTGSDAQTDFQEAMRFGADLYLIKPSNIEEADRLVPAIERFILRSVGSK